MPIQVNEIVIRSIVGDRAVLQPFLTLALFFQNFREAIVAECVEQVMEILKEKSER